MRVVSGQVFGAVALATALVWLPGHAIAGLQKWSLVHVDANGAETTAAKSNAMEARASDQRGFTVAVACHPGGKHSIAVSAPDGMSSDFAGPIIEPSLRISKPGTDLFLGPIGQLKHDGRRYTGKLPEPAAASLLSKIKDGLFAVTEFGTRTTISLKTQSLEFTLQQLGCK